MDSQRIVIGDDDPQFCTWLRSMLNECKEFQIVGEGNDGYETIRLVEANAPNLLIVDMCMPDLDGLKVAKHVRKNHPDTKIILISAHDEPTYETLARNAGILAFVPKTQLSLNALQRVLIAVK